MPEFFVASNFYKYFCGCFLLFTRFVAEGFAFAEHFPVVICEVWIAFAFVFAPHLTCNRVGSTFCSYFPFSVAPLDIQILELFLQPDKATKRLKRRRGHGLKVGGVGAECFFDPH